MVQRLLVREDRGYGGVRPVEDLLPGVTSPVRKRGGEGGPQLAPPSAIPLAGQLGRVESEPAELAAKTCGSMQPTATWRPSAHS